MIDIHGFWQILASVASVFVVMGIGAVCRTRNWLTRQADLSLAKITANVLLPSLFFDRIMSDTSLRSLSTSWQPPTFGFALTATSLWLAFLLARVIGPRIGLVTDIQHRAFALCVGICNYGYIPLPLAQIFYPDAEVELIFHNVGVDLALWSVGIALISGGGESPFARGRSRKAPPQDASATDSLTPTTFPEAGRGEPEARAKVSSTKRKFLPLAMLGALVSPPLIAVLLAVILRALGGQSWIPEPLMKSVGWLAATSIPMGLLLSGAIIIDFIRAADWSGSLPVILASIGFRQILMPILFLGVAMTLVSTPDLKAVLLLQAAMPSAIFPIVLVRLHEGDTATALRAVLATSLAAIVLIPVWMSIGGWWLGI